MFEKLEEEIEIKADEYALEESTACNYGEASRHVYRGYFYGFQKGAEFGYNKANEWHYVKDGKPKDDEYVLIYTDLKNTYVARIPTKKDYFVTRRGGFVQMSAVIAWKEIVLPELNSEENA